MKIALTILACILIAVPPPVALWRIAKNAEQRAYCCTLAFTVGIIALLAWPPVLGLWLLLIVWQPT